MLITGLLLNGLLRAKTGWRTTDALVKRLIWLRWAVTKTVPLWKRFTLCWHACSTCSVSNLNYLLHVSAAFNRVSSDHCTPPLTQRIARCSVCHGCWWVTVSIDRNCNAADPTPSFTGIHFSFGFSLELAFPYVQLSGHLYTVCLMRVLNARSDLVENSRSGPTEVYKTNNHITTLGNVRDQTVHVQVEWVWQVQPCRGVCRDANAFHISDCFCRTYISDGHISNYDVSQFPFRLPRFVLLMTIHKTQESRHGPFQDSNVDLDAPSFKGSLLTAGDSASLSRVVTKERSFAWSVGDAAQGYLYEKVDLRHIHAGSRFLIWAIRVFMSSIMHRIFLLYSKQSVESLSGIQPILRRSLALDQPYNRAWGLLLIQVL